MLPVQMKLTLALSTVLVLLVSGTIIYHYMEKWDWVDSFYFTGTTLTTFDYGDISPKTDFGKVFTVVLAFTSITVVFYSLSIIASSYFQSQQEIIAKRFKLLERHTAKEKQKSTILENMGSSRGNKQ